MADYTVVKSHKIKRGTYKDLKETGIKVQLVEYRNGDFEVHAKHDVFFGVERPTYKGKDVKKAMIAYKDLINLVDL